MWQEQGQDDRAHHDRMGISCFDDEFDGDGVLHMDEHGSACLDLG